METTDKILESKSRDVKHRFAALQNIGMPFATGSALISAALAVAPSVGLSATHEFKPEVEHGAGYRHGQGSGSSDGFGAPIMALICFFWIYLFFKLIAFAIETLTDFDEFKENWLSLLLAVLGWFGLPLLVLHIARSLNT